MKAATIARYSPGVIEIRDIPTPTHGPTKCWSASIPQRSTGSIADRRYPLAEIADAYRYMQTGQKAGVIVIDVVTE